MESGQPIIGVATVDKNFLPRLMLIGENRTGQYVLPTNLSSYSRPQRRVVEDLVADGYQVALFQWVREGKKIVLPQSEIVSACRFPSIPLQYSEAGIWLPSPES